MAQMNLKAFLVALTGVGISITGAHAEEQAAPRSIPRARQHAASIKARDGAKVERYSKGALRSDPRVQELDPFDEDDIFGTNGGDIRL